MSKICAWYKDDICDCFCNGLDITCENYCGDMYTYNCGDIVNTEDNLNAKVEKIYNNGKIKVSVCENVDDKDLTYRTYTKEELDKYN